MSSALTPGQAASRVAADPGAAWWILLSPDSESTTPMASMVVEELAAEGCSAKLLQPTSESEVERAMRADPQTTYVVVGDALADGEWPRLDRARARLEGNGDRRIVLVLSRARAEVAGRAAPNLWSYFGSSTHSLVEDQPLSALEHQERLMRLRTHYGLEDEEVVRRAETGAGGASPDMAEWLTLIGRSDLLRRPAP